MLAHGLGLEVVAEGVEDTATLDLLRDLRCDRAQGFLFSRALPAKQFLEWVKRHADAAESCVTDAARCSNL
jgi:EAL domain-containing protein (putative c-di-GMP-specific phosphodiesterase class I)